MIRSREAFLFALFAICGAVPCPAAAQQTPPGMTAKPPVPDHAEVQGRIVASVDKRQIAEALKTYDAYVGAVRRPDAALLAIIARADLKEIAETHRDDAALVADALERLAKDGDADARQALRKAAAGAPAGSRDAIAFAQSLVRLGDKDATAQLARLLASASPESRPATIRVVEETDLRSAASAIAPYLKDPLPQVRVEAARAVGVLAYRAAIPQLRVLFDRDPVQTVRIAAAMALKRLGEPTADAYLNDLLAAQNPEVRLEAAAAFPPSSSARWVPIVRELRNDPNELTRVRAAGVLACCDAPTARAILAEATASGNPLLRAEAARIYDAKDLADARIARRLLGDQYEVVRVYGAGEALRLASPPQPQRAR